MYYLEQKEELEKSERQFEKYVGKVRKYYHNLSDALDKINSVLSFGSGTGPITDEPNLISAHLWFTTFLLGRKLEKSEFQLSFKNNEHTFVRKHYENLLGQSLKLITFSNILQTYMDSFEDYGASYISQMKKILTGDPFADLVHMAETSSVDNFLVSNQSILELINENNGTSNLTETNWYYARRSSSIYEEPRPKFGSGDFRGKSGSITLEIPLEKRNKIYGGSHAMTVEEIKEMDIFMNNLTKIGWINYEYAYPESSNELDITIINGLLNQIQHRIQVLGKYLQNLNRKLKSKCRIPWLQYCSKCSSGCSSYHSKSNPTPKLVHWIELSEKLLEHTSSKSQWSPRDYENLRFNIYCSEVHLTTILLRGREIYNQVMNVVKVIKISCNLLEKSHKLGIPNHLKLNGKITKEILLYLFGQDDFFYELSAEGIYKDKEFYLSEYAQVLQHIPLRYQTVQFMLCKKLTLMETHSGADFNIRYL